MILSFAELSGKTDLHVDQNIVEVVILEECIALFVLCNIEIIDRSGGDTALAPIVVNTIFGFGILGFWILVFATQRVNTLLSKIVRHICRFKKLFTGFNKCAPLSHHVSLDDIDITTPTREAMERIRFRVVRHAGMVIVVIGPHAAAHTTA